jgi:type I restriction enzyme S subunit
LYGSASFSEAFKENMTGIIGGISRNSFANLCIPLPPLEEQKAIVSIVNTLFKEVEELEQQTKARIQLKEDFVTSALNQLANGDTATEWAYLQPHFHTFFTEKSSIKKLRESILQLAVKGDLTHHWREENTVEEPAHELLLRIKKAQSEWIKQQSELGLKEAGRINKKINNSELKEIAIELPENWEWTSLIRISCAIVDCHNKTAPYVELGIPLVRTTNIKNGKVIKEGVKYITKDTYDFWAKRLPPEPGDIIYTREAPVGEAAIIPEGMTLCMGQRMMLIRPFSYLVSSDFMLLTLMSSDFLNRLSEKEIGMGVKHLRVGDVEDAMLALPPLEEQKAIVEKVNSLMGFCDSLEKEIEQNTRQLEDLMQSCLREVFEN